MGGRGSGRRGQFGANTTEYYNSIDIRWLKREGLLDSSVSRDITWSRGGRRIGSINIRSEPSSVILNYRHRDQRGEWQDKIYPVHLDTTPCHMGGERHWFLCPASGCSRRVAVLYGGAIFACRHCQRLAYPSQRERPGDRATRKADRIRAKLGWKAGILYGAEPWNKPKGMHHATFDRLRWRHDHFVHRAMVGCAEQLGLDLEGKHRF